MAPKEDELPYMLPQEDVEKAKVVIEEDSELVKKVMQDLSHYNEYVDLLK